MLLYWRWGATVPAARSTSAPIASLLFGLCHASRHEGGFSAAPARRAGQRRAIFTRVRGVSAPLLGDTLTFTRFGTASAVGYGG